MIGSKRVLLGAFVVILLVVALLGYEVTLGRATATSTNTTPLGSTSPAPPSSAVSTGSETTTSNTSAVTYAESVTGTSVDSASDVFFSASCVITGVGDFALLIVSDTTGAPVTGESVNAVNHLGCGSMPQVVYLNNFTVEQGGWLTPVFPSQATPAGGLNFTVIYQGRTYHFSYAVSFLGSECVTLHVPSGSVTTKQVMNGEGSYCWQ